jgi:hypothetical protein
VLNLAVRADDLDQRHDLRAERVDKVRMVMDSIRHFQALPSAFFMGLAIYVWEISLLRNAE